MIEAAEKHLEVVVDDSQLSLAIGKKGQNVRLAAKLLGWKIDIKSEEEKRQEVEQQMASLVNQQATPLDRVPDLGEQLIQKLNEAGITTVEALADMTPEQLEELPGVGPKTVEKISIAVNNYFSSLEGAETAAAPEAEVSSAATVGEVTEETPAGSENIDESGEAVQEAIPAEESSEAEPAENAAAGDIAANAEDAGEVAEEDSSGEKMPETKE